MVSQLTPDHFQNITLSHKHAIQVAFSHFDPLGTGYMPIKPCLAQIIESVNGNTFLDRNKFEERLKDILTFLEVPEYEKSISLRDVLKVAAFREFNVETQRKDVVQSFQILKNLNGEISTEKMSKVLCKVFDKVPSEYVEELIGNLEIAERPLDEDELATLTEENQGQETLQYVKDNSKLYDELLTRF